MQEGYIKLFRCIQDNPLWCDEPFTRGQAWVDLLMIANHKQGAIRRRGILVYVDRGQVGYSEDSLAERWKWSRGKVRRYLKELKECKQIEYAISQKTVQKNSSVSSLITITNYDKYQSNDTEDGTENRTEDGTENGTGTRRKRSKDFKNLSSFSENPKNEDHEQPEKIITKKKKILSGKRLDTFKMFWEAFNYKSGRAEAADAWLEIPQLTNSDVDKILAAAKAEAERRPQLIAEGKTPKMAQGWISGRRWEDEAAQRPSLQLVKPVSTITDSQRAAIERQKALIYGNS